MQCVPAHTCAPRTPGAAGCSCPTRRRSCDTPTFRWSSSPDMAGAPGGGGEGGGGPRVLVHADESCLGNDSTKPSPGGNAALIEAPAGDSVARWDFYESSPQTTNNKMALAGASATLEWVPRPRTD